MKTNVGYDIQSKQMGGDGVGDQGVTSGNLTGTGSVTMPDTTQTWTTNAFVGRMVTMVDRTTHTRYFGMVASNTATGLTVHEWQAPSTDATATPTAANTFDYAILPGGAPARHMALSTDATSVSASDTTLPSEITTAGGGLVAKRATYAHTASASTYSLTGVFTVNGSDSLPVTLAKIGLRQSIVAACKCLFQTLLPTTATLTSVGDQITITDTVSM